jgi:hypothetical protein
MTNYEFKVTENKLRRCAHRRGLSLIKSRSRDPSAPDFGKYMIHDIRGRKIVAELLGFEDVRDYLATQH